MTDAATVGGTQPLPVVFTLTLADLHPIGSGLRRPECVLATACGDVYVSDQRGGVAVVRPDGTISSYTARALDGTSMAANGFALLPDGSFLIAPLSGGGVFRLYRDGRAEPWLREVDGRAIETPNFVLRDDSGRVWICCFTTEKRAEIESFRRDRRDGFIVLVDHRRARIVAADIGYPNEVRVNPARTHLYATETMAGRLVRYPIGANNTLGTLETVVEFDASNILDGFAFDSLGGAWVTAVVSNRLWYVSPDGRTQLLIEDSDANQLTRLREMQRNSAVEKTLIGEEHGSTLRNISSVAFGGPDLRTVYLGNLMGDQLMSFRSPVPGARPAHWDFGPFV